MPEGDALTGNLGGEPEGIGRSSGNCGKAGDGSASWVADGEGGGSGWAGGAGRGRQSCYVPQDSLYCYAEGLPAVYAAD